MKTFFAAALLAASASAVQLNTCYDELAQIAAFKDDSAKATNLAEGATYVGTDTTTITDADCESL